MPTYTNSTDSILIVGSSYIRLDPGENVTSTYIGELPTGVTLTDHEPIVSPWVLLASVASVPMASPVDVSAYDNIMVYNASDALSTVSANTDDSNAYPIMPASVQVFSNTGKLFGCLEVITMGSGTVYVYGVK